MSRIDKVILGPPEINTMQQVCYENASAIVLCNPKVKEDLNGIINYEISLPMKIYFAWLDNIYRLLGVEIILNRQIYIKSFIYMSTRKRQSWVCLKPTKYNKKSIILCTGNISKNLNLIWHWLAFTFFSTHLNNVSKKNLSRAISIFNQLLFF